MKKLLLSGALLVSMAIAGVALAQEAPKEESPKAKKECCEAKKECCTKKKDCPKAEGCKDQKCAKPAKKSK